MQVQDIIKTNYNHTMSFFLNVGINQVLTGLILFFSLQFFWDGIEINSMYITFVLLMLPLRVLLMMTFDFKNIFNKYRFSDWDKYGNVIQIWFVNFVFWGFVYAIAISMTTIMASATEKTWLVKAICFSILSIEVIQVRSKIVRMKEFIPFKDKWATIFTKHEMDEPKTKTKYHAPL